DFQHEVSGKYIGVNYLNKKLVEVRNIKVSLNSKSLETIIKDIINALFPDKLPNVKEIKHTKKIKQILSETFQNNNGKDIKNSLNENLLIIRFTKKGPKIIKVTKEIKDLIGGE
ncbi:MAG: hypothetical protein RSC57_02865, partial [Bacilli bacterium]